MGTGSSISCPPLAVQHVTLTLQTPNVIALMDSDGPTGIGYQTMLKEWKPGIESIVDVQYFNAFELKERPFASSLLGSNQTQVLATARARQAMCHLLSKLNDKGIKLLTSVYTGKMFSRSTIFFERELVAGGDSKMWTASYPVPDRFVCIAIRSRNVLQIPVVPGIANVKLDWLRSQFKSQLNGDESTEEFIEFTFKGQPFGNTNRYEEMITSKRLFLQVVRHFAESGYELAMGLSLRGCRNDTTFFKAVSRSPDSQPPNYFLLCAEERNRLRLFECPVAAAREIESSVMSGQIREIKPSYMGCSEILFTSTPFDTDSAALAETQLMFLEMISRLWSLGWKLKGVLHLSLGRYNKSSLLFETTAQEPRPTFGLSMVRNDTIKLLNAPTNVRTVVRETVIAVWPKGLQSESEISRGCCLKLRGRPFAIRDVSADCYEGLHLVVCIVERLRLSGWHIHCGLDVGARFVNEEDTHAYSVDGSMILFIRSDFSTGTFD